MKRIITLAAGLAFALCGPASAATNWNAAKPDANTKAHAGIINTNGSVIAGTGFTVTHNATGMYTIVFPNNTFKACPAVNVTPAGGNGGIPIANVYGYGCSNGGATIVITINSIETSASQDNAFHFSTTDI